MRTETNKKQSRSIQECHDRGELDAMMAVMSPDLIATANGGGAMNRAQFDGMVRMIAASFSNGRHVFDNQVTKGDWVATRMTWTALHTGDFNGIPASNRPVSVATSVYDRFKDGKIVEHHALFDVMGMITRIGTIPVAA